MFENIGKKIKALAVGYVRIVIILSIVICTIAIPFVFLVPVNSDNAGMMIMGKLMLAIAVIGTAILISVAAWISSFLLYGFGELIDKVTDIANAVAKTTENDAKSSTTPKLDPNTNVTIPPYVTSIEDLEFSNRSELTSITIPPSVKSIGYEAFRNCSSLTSITIPSSVTSMGDDVFCGCKLQTIYCRAASKPEGWSAEWNSANVPVVWGYTGE